ncbi:hypothetical protein DPMN_040924 [Dreissena polymorpha]|uniref:Uncharacterized protein n=1 Tax=Dreissena polymorpha TaxID=45954 RepID=A0A9D4HTH9_DREPO|nr:hypothetical protein DPMN_040924 [Dreissena polymorpha]
MKSEAEILHFFCDMSCRASSYVVSTNDESNGLDLRTICIKKESADDIYKEGICGPYK